MYKRQFLDDAIFTEADLSHAILRYSKMTNADCKGATFIRADISLADLTRVNCNDANMAHCDLRGTNLAGANLNGANLTGANMLDSKMVDVKMAGVHMENAIGPHGQLVPTHREVIRSSRWWEFWKR